MPYEAGFARIYDRIISRQIDFDGYCSFLLSLCADRGVNVRFALDIGCGSGIFTQQLVNRGIDTAAFDISEDMLTLAAQRLGGKCRLFCADMTDFCFDEQFDAAFCTLDGLNHLSGAADLRRAVKCTAKCIKSGGVFVFDVNTPHKHKNALGNNTFVFEDEDYYLVWQNFTSGTKTDMLIDCFIEDESGWQRYSEEFCERAYTDETLEKILTANGFCNISRYDFETYGEVRKNSEKIIYIATKG